MGWTIVGVDEVGRGCLAGPVVCAAVIIPNEDRPWVDLIKDSKKLSLKRRQLLSEYIIEECIYSIREGSPELVDSQNILQATLRTMKACVESVASQMGSVDFVLVDGNQKIPELSIPQKAVIHGDALHKAIGAASIIAKVYRDNYMVGMDELYPEYGFAQHKGYGTEQHRKAVMIHGPCKIHRLTFKGVHEYAVKGSTAI